jgi:hypothetical protein
MSGIRNPETLDWTPARTAEAMDLKRRGWSARDIAEKLGGTTRQAVIAHVWRQKSSSKRDRGGRMDESVDPGCKTKALQIDLSTPRLQLRRFSWEGDTA